METIPYFLLPVMLAVVLVRLLLLPLRPLCRLGLHAAGGFACLWLLNAIAPFTGILLPVNAVTVLTAGICGLPGIALIAFLEVL